MNIKNKIILSIMLIIIINSIVFALFSIFHLKTQINHFIADQTKITKIIASTIAKHNNRSYKQRIKSFVSRFNLDNQVVIQALKHQNREELLSLSTPYLNLFRKENPDFSTLAFVLPDGTNFLRVHNPKKFGDNISKMRPDIVDANLALHQNSGYIVAGTGLIYSIVQPIISQQHMGLVQFGIRESQLLDEIKQKLDVPVGVIVSTDKAKFITNSKMPNFSSSAYSIRSSEIDFFKEVNASIDWRMEQQRVTIGKKHYIIIKILELCDYSGQIQGHVIAALNISKQISYIYSNIIFIVILCLIFLFLSFLVLNKGYGILSGKITIKSQELNAEKERLAVTLRSIGDGVITTDLNGKIVLINKITEKLTGWSQQEAVGRPIQEVFNIINEKTGKPCENSVEKVLATGRIVDLANHQTALIARDGTQYIIEDCGAPIFDKANNIIGTVLVYRDVTEEIKTKKELAKIRQLESIGVLAGGIAHDFNNLLYVVMGNISLARDDLKSEIGTSENLKAAEEACIKAKELSARLIVFSKGGDPVKKSMSIDNLLKNVVISALNGSKIKPKIFITDAVKQVDIDEGQIKQVIRNIVVNAREAMDDNGQLTVSCKNIDIAKEGYLTLNQGEYIKISFIDQGCGISKESLEKIFDPYFSTKDMGVDKGQGLGLTVSYSIVQKHGGLIHVESELETGSIFSVYLPAATSVNEPDLQKAEGELATQKTLKQPGIGTGKILLMDDEESIRIFLGQAIKRLGYDVKTCTEGKEAIEIYKKAMELKEPFDVVILDLTNKLGMGGQETMKRLLEIDHNAKGIVITGYFDDPVVTNFKTHGFSGFLAKPATKNELSKVIDEVISRD